MWHTFWRAVDRFSIEHFKSVINELRRIKVVNKQNMELVMDLLQSIVEIVTYGDRQDPFIFECFMEHQVLAEFVRILKISKNSKIEAPLLQYLSILIQNMDSEHSIYYCFSNDYINNIISHPYIFDGGDLAPYYVSFLRAVSSKVNRDTLCLLVKVHGDAVVSFPLYTEALRFAHHEERMIKTAIRALTLNIYHVSDVMVFRFITTPPVSEYFSDLVYRLRDICFHLDACLHSRGEMDMQKGRNSLIVESDKVVDDLYYLKDILSVGEPCLSRLVTENLLDRLVFPIIMSLLASKENNESELSAITSLYVLSLLLQVVGGRWIINNVAGVILYPLLTLNVRHLNEGNASHEHNGVYPFSKHVNEVKRVMCSAPECKGVEGNDGNYDDAHMADFMSSFNVRSFNGDIYLKRDGILAYIFSDHYVMLLASLFLLLILSESKDLDCAVAPVIGLYKLQTDDESTSKSADGGIFIKFMPEILNALLKVLAFQQSLSAMTLWHTGWCFLKLLSIHRVGLHGDNLHLFNTSCKQSREGFLKELDGIWFDHIPNALRSQWASCKRVLEESSQHKDPLFLLELALHRQSINGETSSYFAWQGMIDAVKVFILHIQLKSYISKGVLVENPLLLGSPTTNDSGAIHASDVSNASFGSDVSLESGAPCRIAFSNSEIRDIYLIPVASGMAGKLLLAEKHPFRSHRGVVIAIAPLAGLSPKIDEEHPSWLRLQIREFDAEFYTNSGNGKHLNPSDHVTDGRWTIGFPNKKACESAKLTIMSEITKQRSAVEYILAPLLQYDLGLAVTDT
ncbi:protein TRANSPARENT TESTA 9 isoform X2 [Neltuma alba]|uniref:protein TRANSPARENT TESTA 9 isoform X2 n=1 Tax=Neltuma alba TaxID=207710 RepID=UPI0010A49FC9|nr:protein TRANSPARENT TESTA 9-like isoform X2 [Prosopis alba]XP_028789804.1 protein TRANSPARENT TESTA 9-like isoform X2 [Prosopis alba]